MSTGPPAATTEPTVTGRDADDSGPPGRERAGGSWRGRLRPVVRGLRAHPWLVVAAVTGLVLRVVVLTTPAGVLDSDEAVVGLVARHILDGELTAFFWGQAYGGNLEALLTAAVFAVTGPSTLGLKLVPMALSAVAAVLVGRVMFHVAGARAGGIAAAAFWVWPWNYIWWSTKSRGFYWTGTVLGLVVVLIAVRLATRPTSRRDWALLGLAAGLGWWATPQVVFFVVPAMVWLALRRPTAMRTAPWALPTAVLGALPWLTHNVRNDWASLDLPGAGGLTYLDRLHSVLTDGFPMVLGLRMTYSHSWVHRPTGLVLVALAAAGIVAVAVLDTRRLALPLLGVGLFPFLHAVSPYAAYMGEGRYLLFVVPFLAMLLAARLDSWPVVAVTFAVLLAVTASGLASIRGGNSPYATDRRVPLEMGPLIDTLEDEGVEEVFANYWIAYRLAFETDEAVVATPLNKPVRHLPYERRVRASEDAAWVFVTGDSEEEVFPNRLVQVGVTWRAIETGGFTVYLLDRHVLPETLPPPTAGG